VGELPDSLFLNPVWHALRGPHRHLARTARAACRYPADVVPFAAIDAPSAAAFADLRSLLEPEESAWIFDYGCTAPGLAVVDALECVQMVLPGSVDLGAPSRELLPLGAEHAQEMVALTGIAFPGFFRPGHPEMSAICTHPEHRGEGLATDIIRHLARVHRVTGLVSWLHVAAANQRAIDLYASLGFARVRSLMLHRITLTG
jgi:ribosomal protein S18 acetylase RimI-like enzyme